MHFFLGNLIVEKETENLLNILFFLRDSQKIKKSESHILQKKPLPFCVMTFSTPAFFIRKKLLTQNLL